uniref:IQ motif containing C n=2 Tax=Nothobranchius kadleci TaxID=1051664 RepID=A0A1A8BCI4_NOTKA
MVMDRDKLEMVITHFQARARGFLTRSDVRRAREDFEEIVMEIDGALRHLRWTETVISIPHFTDTDRPWLCPSNIPSEPDLEVTPTLSPAPVSEADHDVLVERSEAERDDSQTHLPRTPVREEEEEQKRITSGGAGRAMKSMSSSTIWSSVELGANSHEGPRLYHLAQDVPRTPQALRLHRNTLTMELVWLQQAIDSRKKYLSLKNRLSAS